jgi:hypothetical protein
MLRALCERAQGQRTQKTLFLAVKQRQSVRQIYPTAATLVGIYLRGLLKTLIANNSQLIIPRSILVRGNESPSRMLCRSAKSLDTNTEYRRSLFFATMAISLNGPRLLPCPISAERSGETSGETWNEP